MKKYIYLNVALMLILPAIAGAQYRRDGGPRGDRSERISRIIADCEQRTDAFQQAFRRALERGGIRNTQREDDLNRDASRLERALNKIRESWNRDHDPNRTRHFVGSAVSAGQDINRTMSRHRLNSYVQREWQDIRMELNRLAEVFDQPKIRW